MPDLLDLMQKAVPIEAVRPNTIRGHGKGTLATVRCYLGRMPLQDAPESREEFAN